MTDPRNVPAPTSFAVGPDALGAAVDAACAFAAAEALDEHAAAKLAIIVEELVANLLDHAGLGDGERFGLEMTHSSSCVTVVLSDRGRPFDPRGAPAPADLPPERGGGAGLALVQAWAHIDSYTRIGETNRLTLSLPVG